MINAGSLFQTMLNSPVRTIRARVELLNGSTLVNTFRYRDALKSFTIDRVGDSSKFFGYGICQKVNVKLLDINRDIDISTANSFNIAFGVDSDYIDVFPPFYVTEVHRDEEDNELSITAYDALYKASSRTVSELAAVAPYTIGDFATACAALLGLPINSPAIEANTAFETVYDNGANFDGTESIREALDAIAEATQTIYFINNDWELTFKQLDISGAAILNIDKEKYITLKSSTNRKLSKIAHVTELGDNVAVSLTDSGTTQYIRNNPFYDLRDDVGTLLSSALSAIGGLTINQFECEWRGNFLLEIGDKITLTTKDNGTVTSYLLDDTIEYNGVLSGKSQWQYSDNEEETEENPATIGDAIKQTYARVDKANKQIELVASNVAENAESISALQVNAESISASVTEIESTTNSALDAVNGDITTLTKKVESTMTSEQVELKIQSELSNGVDKVTTSTGFTFNEDGLTVEKSGSEISTQITEDGMKVYKNDDVVLTANNKGVEAFNLHATTYLIIGTNSRFEDYDENRTGCFYIGG